ncbi:MAG: 30S ribosomal protein S6 [Bacillota bacterium]
MTTYECMYIVRPDLDEEKTAEVMEKFQSIVQGNGGTVESSKPWGKRRLAYEIKGFREGLYVLLRFAGEAATVRELERLLKISDEVIRHMVVKEEA